ncbi:MAG: HIT domain-containing protein [Actinobacteria bacterium]|nr:HIT domain-containing protein [Actinomycetota bacterium]
MAFEQLWNGWRSQYVAGAPRGSDPPRDGQSVFTAILESGAADEETHIVYRGVSCFAILNAYPYASGHLLVLPYRQVGDLCDLSAEETAELWSIVTDATVAVRAAFGPEGVNIGINMGRAAGGSIAEHLHVHVVPRWVGDSNFMTAIANTRTLPVALDETAERLRRAWPSAGAGPKVSRS